MQVSGLVLEHGGSIDQAMAGLLHDTIEDCDIVNEALIRERFGSEVARIVQNCSDTLEGDTPGKKASWELRKKRYIARLEQADSATKLVVACDKLDNLRSLLGDLEVDGVRTLNRFTGSPRQTRWYYDEVRRTLGQKLPSRLLSELDSLLTRLHGYISESSPKR